jgi:dTDP-4-amino-4,6-dideoxygalactose transaminase
MTLRFVRLAHPEIPVKALPLIAGLLESGRLTSGDLVARLEERLSKRLEGRHVVLVSSGTTAALVGFHLLFDRGVRRVVMPDFLFPSMASAALRAGVEPVLADIEPERLGLPPDALSRVPPGGKAAVLSVDQFGIPGFAGPMEQLSSSLGLPWFEDAACGLGSRDDDGRACATRSTISILSFHPRKTLTTAEGGAVVTSDPDLAARARLLRNLGISGQGTERRFDMAGYNARMSELHAAVGLAQEEILDELLERRRCLGRRYLERLDGDVFPEGFSVPAGFRHPGCSFQSLVVLLQPGIDRGEVVRRMAAEGIETTLPGFSIRSQPVFSALPAFGPLPNSTRLQESGLALPLHERMEPQDVDSVCEALQRALVPGK